MPVALATIVMPVRDARLLVGVIEEWLEDQRELIVHAETAADRRAMKRERDRVERAWERFRNAVEECM